MTRFRQDPLLTIARWLLLFLMGVFAIGLAAPSAKPTTVGSRC